MCFRSIRRPKPKTAIADARIRKATWIEGDRVKFAQHPDDAVLGGRTVEFLAASLDSRSQYDQSIRKPRTHPVCPPATQNGRRIDRSVALAHPERMGYSDHRPLWKVRDVAAHLLDTVLRKFPMVRDSCYVEAVDIRSSKDPIASVNRLNREGMTV